jgi:hypothetical protein
MLRSVYIRRDFTMAILMVYKRNSKFVDLSELVEKLSSLGLTDTLKEYYYNPSNEDVKSIVAGPSFCNSLTDYFKSKLHPGISYT